MEVCYLVEGPGGLKGIPLGNIVSTAADHADASDWSSKMTSLTRVRTEQFRELQDTALFVLKQYWLQRFIIHCHLKEKNLKQSQFTRSGNRTGGKSDEAAITALKTIDKALGLLQDKPVNNNNKQTRLARGEVSWRAMFPAHNVDNR